MAFSAHATSSSVRFSSPDEDFSLPSSPITRFSPEENRIAELIRRHGDSRSLLQARHLHAQIARLHLDASIFITNLLMEMYSKCGSVIDARKLFDSIYHPNIFSWTIIISAYASNGHPSEALLMFRRMDLDGTRANKVTFLAILSACSSLQGIVRAREMHRRIISQGIPQDPMLRTAVISMYGKCGKISESESEFQCLAAVDRCIVASNALLTSYALNGYPDRAFDLYMELGLRGINPDSCTFLTMLSLCSGREDLELGKLLHSHASSLGLDRDTLVANCIIAMYSRCLCSASARGVFDYLREKNVFSWAIMIEGHVRNREHREAIKLFQLMNLAGMEPDSVTYVNLLGAFCDELHPPDPQQELVGRSIHQRITSSGLETHPFIAAALITMHGRAGRIQEAGRIFEVVKTPLDVALWNSLLGVIDRGEQAVKLLWAMLLEGMRPNSVTFSSVLRACHRLELGNRVAEVVKVSGYGEPLGVRIGSSMVEMLGRCGSLSEARRVFDQMPKRDVDAWAAMIRGYSDNGLNREALVMFEQMDFDECLEPDEGIYRVVLWACCCLGAVSELRKIHSRLVSRRSLSRGLGAMLVASYGSCGFVDEAMEVFEELSFKDVEAWNAMIRACVVNGFAVQAMCLFRWMELEGVKADGETFESLMSACPELGWDEEERVYERALSCGYPVLKTRREAMS